jgi:hypothetical protein
MRTDYLSMMVPARKAAAAVRLAAVALQRVCRSGSRIWQLVKGQRHMLGIAWMRLLARTTMLVRTEYPKEGWILP